MRRMIFGVALALAACGRAQEPTVAAIRQPGAWERPLRPEHPELVAVKADIARLDGQWAEVRGTVTRTSFVAPAPVRRDGEIVAARDEGTALVLEDCTEIRVNLGAPLVGWEVLVNQRVSVVALVWNSTPRETPGAGGSSQPSISSWEAPHPMGP